MPLQEQSLDRKNSLQLYCTKMTQKGVASSEEATLYFMELMQMATGEFHFGQQTYFQEPGYRIKHRAAKKECLHCLVSSNKTGEMNWNNMADLI